MVIEYRVVDMNDGTIVPFTPMWRRKLTGWVSIFQFLFNWQTFTTTYFTGRPKSRQIDRVRFGDKSRAVDFLRGIKSPWDYEGALRENWDRKCREEMAYFTKQY